MKTFKNSPNLLKFYEIHETENSIYIIIEYIKGGSV